MFPLNKRFYELCQALKIDPRDEAAPEQEGTRAFYIALRKQLLGLLENRYSLVDGTLVVEAKRNQGLASALWHELRGEGPKTAITEETARSAVYRLHGFVETPDGGWVLPPRAAAERQSSPTSASEQLAQSLSVIPGQVRERINELSAERADLLHRYLTEAALYVRGRSQEPKLPEPPWNQRYEIARGHEFLEEFLRRARRARYDITLAAVDLYITASTCRALFLDRLKANVRIRVLIFNFLHEDVSYVARMIRRSPDVLRALSNDTVEAFLRIREAAGADGKNLEVRLLNRDPQGRWYIIDPHSDEGEGASAFTVSRAPGAATRASDAGGGWETTRHVIRGYARHVEHLWAEAQDFDAWLPSYERWRARPETKTILGE